MLWDCGEHQDLGKEHNVLTARLHDIVVAPSPSPEASPDLTPLRGTVLISRHRSRSTLDVAHVAFTYVAKHTHAAAFGGKFLWGKELPVDDRMSKHGQLGVTACQSDLPGNIRHRDR